MSKNNTVFVGKNKDFWERNRRSGGYLLKKRLGQIAISVIRGLLLFGLCFMIIQPLLTRFSMSLMQEKDLYDSTIILLPRNVTLDNYRIVAELTDLKAIGGNWHFNALLNTLWVSALISALTIISTTLVAYGFARYNFRGKKFWFACVIAVIIIPPQTIQSALYMNFANFDILKIFTLFGVNAEGLNFGQRVLSVVDGTGVGLIQLLTGSALNLRANVSAYAIMALTCMGLKNGLYIYIMRQYFQGIPTSLEEAAYVDGCGTLHTFIKIMLPDALPTIASCFLFSFVWQWTDIFYTRLFLPITSISTYSNQMASMVTKMSRYFSADSSVAVVVPNGRQQQLISIAVLICAIPLVILYLFTQRTFVESLAMSGSKE
ncbi:MAG: carbohydrate ABC transporter permease [Clostridiales bacterium]|nr:carbohydrate ABC transporter permease [Clostridiales bacterium]